MGLLSGRSTAVALRAAHWVLTRVVARTPYAIDPSRNCIAFLIPHLPATKAVTAGLICQWLQRTATWDKYKYASFHVQHSSPHHTWCGDWNEDLIILRHITPPPPCISYALVQATVGEGTVIILCVI